ncbi:hypothetical protein BS47DRAFT_1388109 [Hydnum rufescens UP504]|uniref:Uncharacterized protein n=1 Tax=Hydnum rufescens UP504 TaxID=1448309 RepID=A0A9P6B866_9AGAM|nr:hypothetical protein BS47DRAFT_1388109 [Hydnum rufescens UP504]
MLFWGGGDDEGNNEQRIHRNPPAPIIPLVPPHRTLQLDTFYPTRWRNPIPRPSQPIYQRPNSQNRRAIKSTLIQMHADCSFGNTRSHLTATYGDTSLQDTPGKATEPCVLLDPTRNYIAAAGSPGFFNLSGRSHLTLTTTMRTSDDQGACASHPNMICITEPSGTSPGTTVPSESEPIGPTLSTAFTPVSHLAKISQHGLGR